jgi:hypothetical protein
MRDSFCNLADESFQSCLANLAKSQTILSKEANKNVFKGNQAKVEKNLLLKTNRKVGYLTARHRE